jgi:hypothetical protein
MCSDPFQCKVAQTTSVEGCLMRPPQSGMELRDFGQRHHGAILAPGTIRTYADSSLLQVPLKSLCFTTTVVQLPFTKFTGLFYKKCYAIMSDHFQPKVDVCFTSTHVGSRLQRTSTISSPTKRKCSTSQSR